MPFTIIIIGASGIIAQIVLIRELLVNFQGNELSIGLILGNWLVAEAFGSYLVRRIKISVRHYKTIIFSFAVIFPLLCILVRLIRPILGVLPGEIITIPAMYISSLLILLPVGLIHGVLFTSSISVVTQKQSISKTKVSGYVYILENVGTIIGGIVISFFLIPYLSSLQIGLILGIVNIIAVLSINKFRFPLSRYLCYASILFFCFMLFISRQIELQTLKQNFPHYNIVSSTNTIYSNITVANREEQCIFFVDGVPTIITPYPDQAFVEDFVNFALLSHPAPKKLLLISGGAGGVLTQMLKYPIQEIDYVELDPFLIKLVSQFSTPLIIQEFSNPRVKIINTDARFYLEKDTSKYDLIFISFLSPLSLKINRFFTKEFFMTCKNKLNKEGTLVTISPGSFTYISPTLRELINSHLATLHTSFPVISVIPGDFNLYLSQRKKSLSNLNADTLYHRLLRRNISTNLFSLSYIQYRTKKSFIDNLFQSLHSEAINEKSIINKDGNPCGLFYNLFYWNTITNPSFQRIFSLIKALNLNIIIFALLVVFLLLLMKRKYGYSIYIPFTIFTTGIVAMVFSLILSLGFQVRYGYLYYQISILLTTFIAGSALGGYIGNLSALEKRPYFLYSEIFIVILLSLLLISFKNQAYPNVFGTQIDFFIFLFLAGFLTGIQFLMANKMYNTDKLEVATVAGKLYAADLLGGFIGAITLSVVLIPIIGIQQTLIAALFLKLISTLLVLTVTSFSIE